MSAGEGSQPPGAPQSAPGSRTPQAAPGWPAQPPYGVQYLPMYLYPGVPGFPVVGQGPPLTYGPQGHYAVAHPPAGVRSGVLQTVPPRSELSLHLPHQAAPYPPGYYYPAMHSAERSVRPGILVPVQPGVNSWVGMHQPSQGLWPPASPARSQDSVGMQPPPPPPPPPPHSSQGSLPRRLSERSLPSETSSGSLAGSFGRSGLRPERSDSGPNISRGDAGRQPCAFFLKTGTCAYGHKCRFAHPADQIPLVHFNILGLPMRPGEPDCSFYLNNMRCGFGPSCKYNHPEPPAPLAAASGALPMPFMLQYPPPSPGAVRQRSLEAERQQGALLDVQRSLARLNTQPVGSVNERETLKEGRASSSSRQASGRRLSGEIRRQRSGHAAPSSGSSEAEQQRSTSAAGSPSEGSPPLQTAGAPEVSGVVAATVAGAVDVEASLLQPGVSGQLHDQPLPSFEQPEDVSAEGQSPPEDVSEGT